MAEPPDHPYLSARYRFEQLFGDLARGRRSWQTVAVISLLTNLILILGFTSLALQHKVVPYVVELDALGETRSAGPLEVGEIPERALEAALRRFVHNARTVPTDARLLNVRLQDAKAYTSGRAAKTLIDELNRERPRLEQMLRRGDTRYVEHISSVLRMPGEGRLYRVSWRERERVGMDDRESAFEGHFQLHLQPGTSEDVLQVNPMGILITDYTWTRVSESSP